MLIIRLGKKRILNSASVFSHYDLHTSPPTVLAFIQFFTADPHHKFPPHFFLLSSIGCVRKGERDRGEDHQVKSLHHPSDMQSK